MNKAPGIYEIKNTISGVLYIGSSVNMHKRIATHKRELSEGKHKNQKLMRSWIKYGEKAFSFSLVELVSELESLIVREQYWIDYFQAQGQSMFNISLVAGSTLGVVCSDDRRRKISEAKNGVPIWSDEDKLKMSAQRQGRVVSLEVRNKISRSRIGKGVAHSDETRKKMSESRIGNKNCLGRTLSEEHRRKISESLTGTKHKKKPLPDGVRRPQSGTGMLGKRHSEETREKIADANRKRWAALKDASQ